MSSDLGGGDLWRALQGLADSCAIAVDRPRGSVHPRFPEFVYPVDYGYLIGTVGGDGEGIDCWMGGNGIRVVGLFVTADPFKRNSEVKLLLGCSSEEIAEIERFYDPQPQRALLVLRAKLGDSQ